MTSLACIRFLLSPHNMASGVGVVHLCWLRLKVCPTIQKLERKRFTDSSQDVDVRSGVAVSLVSYYLCSSLPLVQDHMFAPTTLFSCRNLFKLPPEMHLRNIMSFCAVNNRRRTSIHISALHMTICANGSESASVSPFRYIIVVYRQFNDPCSCINCKWILNVSIRDFVVKHSFKLGQ